MRNGDGRAFCAVLSVSSALCHRPHTHVRRWSTRAEYARRHEAARPVSVASYGSGIAVNVHQSETTSMPSSPMTGTCASFQAATLDGGDDDDVPPPLPSKIRV